MKTFSILIEDLIKGLVYGILPFLLFVLITSRTSIIGGVRSFVVVSGSMEPTLPVGTIVFTHPFDQYNPNDVIAFKQGDKNITHRIIDTDYKDGQVFYRTMGDANNSDDREPVTKNTIWGGVFFSVPFVGRIVFLLKTIPGYLTLIILPAVLYIIFELLNINSELKKIEEGKLTKQINII